MYYWEETDSRINQKYFIVLCQSDVGTQFGNIGCIPENVTLRL